jgi:hypothetical protein
VHEALAVEALIGIFLFSSPIRVKLRELFRLPQV